MRAPLRRLFAFGASRLVCGGVEGLQKASLCRLLAGRREWDSLQCLMRVLRAEELLGCRPILWGWRRLVPFCLSRAWTACSAVRLWMSGAGRSSAGIGGQRRTVGTLSDPS